MLEKKIKEKAKWKGRVTFTTLKIDSYEAQAIHDKLSVAENMPELEFERYFSQLKEICEVREETFDNQIVAVGRQVFAQRLINDLTYTGVINYGAVGTGSTAIADVDTVLDTEVKRKGVATRSRTGTSVSIRFFFSKSDVNGTFEEFGTFIDGTSSADTGQMFNRVLTGGWVKSALEALTVTVQFDLNPQ